MPSKSEKQRRLMAIALHYPDKVYKRNQSVLNMSKSDLHDFAVKIAKKRKKKGN